MAPASASASSSPYVSTPYHDHFLAELLLSHSAKDFCIIGPKGCGKSVVLNRLADMLGYEVEPIMLYQGRFEGETGTRMGLFEAAFHSRVYSMQRM